MVICNSIYYHILRTADYNVKDIRDLQTVSSLERFGTFFQLQETILPILLHRPSARRVMNKIHKKLDDNSAGDNCNHDMLETIDCLEKNDPKVSNAILVFKNAEAFKF